MREEIAGLVLAGGLSRRMGGGDKSLKQLGRRPMLSRVIERLAPQVGAMVLNANGDPARFEPFGLPIVSDPIEGFAGPLAGVLAGMAWAEGCGGPFTHVVSVASDTPFFPADLVDRFIAAAEGQPRRIVLAASDGNRHPVFGLWPIALKHDLEQWMTGTDTYKVLAWTGRHDCVLCGFDMVALGERHIDPFFNANTPEELAEAEGLLSELAG
jgi:molybdopterin-guanine dinucleotide biosynthesis protein A